jgi:hypothetical protein
MLIYSLVYIYTLLEHVRKKAPTEERIGTYKLTATPAQFCEGTPFAPLLEEAYSYGFDEEPFYGKLKHMMQIILMAEYHPPARNFVYDFNISSQDQESNINDSDELTQIKQHITKNLVKKTLDFGKALPAGNQNNQLI